MLCIYRVHVIKMLCLNSEHVIPHIYCALTACVLYIMCFSSHSNTTVCSQ
jgi:hypothetical protein